MCSTIIPLLSAVFEPLLGFGTVFAHWIAVNVLAGMELDFECTEKRPGQWNARLELPVDSPTGHAVYAEACVTGKKKDAINNCALEACRVLDKHGMFKQSGSFDERQLARSFLHFLLLLLLQKLYVFVRRHASQKKQDACCGLGKWTLIWTSIGDAI